MQGEEQWMEIISVNFLDWKRIYDGNLYFVTSLSHGVRYNTDIDPKRRDIV